MRRQFSLRATMLALALLVAGAAGACSAAALDPPGRMVDIGGRRMHIVCEGAKSAAPTVLFESGAFGFSADWAVVQGRLTAGGVRSCAYDRAGLGFSDPGPEPRDSLAIVGDLEKLLKAADEPGPFVLVGHSMAGIHVRLFAARNPGRVAGLVLVDATTPEAINDPATRRYVNDFTTGTHAAAVAAGFGVLAPLRASPLANKIGLTGEAEKEKRWMFGSAAYNRAAFAEVEQWPLSAREAQASGALDPRWPVAVIAAGKGDEALRDVQKPPALASRHGLFEVAPHAGHDALLGPKYCDAIVQAIRFVRSGEETMQASLPPVGAQR